MKISKLTLKNFRSFADRHEVFFNHNPGLYAIKGDNCVASIGSNGAGKSSILDAIHYAFTGHTSQGLRGDNLKTRGSKGVYGVRLEFTHNDREYNLFRCRNPSHLKLDGEEISQDTIDNLFNLSVDDMLKALISSQVPEFFLMQTPAKRLETFEDALGLSVWERAAKISREQQKTLDNDAAFMQGKKEGLEKTIETLEQKVEELQERCAGFDQERDQRVRVLEKEREVSAKQVELLKKECEALSKKEGAVSLPPEDARIPPIEARLKKVVEDKAACLASAKQLDLTIQKEKEMIRQGACPTCGAPITDRSAGWHEHHARHEKQFREMADTSEARIAEEAELVSSLDAMKAELREREQAALAVSGELSAKKAELSKHSDSVERANADIEKEKTSTNPYLELVEKEKQAKQAADKELSDILSRLKQHESVSAAVSYWSQGFKHILLNVVDQALVSLQMEANSILDGLGLSSTLIEFSTERQTSQKKISRGFFINIHVDGEEVPSSSFSGGELQRINVALGMAFGSLMRNSHGFHPDQEFYDEPTQNLSKEGTLDLIRYLEQRARDHKISIYLIDHKGPNSVQTAFTVIKDNNGSRIQPT